MDVINYVRLNLVLNVDLIVNQVFILILYLKSINQTKYLIKKELLESKQIP